MPDEQDKYRPDLPSLSRADEDAYNDYVRHFRRNVLPKMQESTFVSSFLPDADGVDVKFATELGMAIMLDKPIFAIAAPGRPVPAGVRKVAGKILVMEADIDTTEGAAELAEAMKAYLETFDK